MNVVICDDSIISIKKYSYLIEKIGSTNNIKFYIKTFSSGSDLMFYLEDDNYVDLILLDIMIPGSSGIEIAREIRDMGMDTKIIFLTSLEDKMIDAFDVNAYHYIIKDVTTKEKFENIILNVFREINDSECEKVVFSFRNQKKVLPVKDILYFEVYDHNIYIHHKNGKFKIYDTLDNIEKRLIDKGFIRIHKSYIVSNNYIKNIKSNLVELSSGDILPVGRKYSKIINTNSMN